MEGGQVPADSLHPAGHLLRGVTGPGISISLFLITFYFPCFFSYLNFHFHNLKENQVILRVVVFLVWSRDPWETLKTSQGVCEIKTVFQITLRHYLLVHVHSPTLYSGVSRGHVACCWKRWNAEADIILQRFSSSQALKIFGKTWSNVILFL